MNKCRNCIYWAKCLGYRYENCKKEYMKEVRIKPISDGRLVVYVVECEKYHKWKPFTGNIY